MSGRRDARCGWARRRGGQRGAAGAEYLAATLVVLVMFVGLLVLRDHRASRRAPVNPIPPIIRLLGDPLTAPRAPRIRPPRPPRPTPRPRTRPPTGITVRLPTWWR